MQEEKNKRFMNIVTGLAGHLCSEPQDDDPGMKRDEIQAGFLLRAAAEDTRR